MKKARRIKIRIKAQGKRVWIPSIPFWLIRTAWRIARPFVAKKLPDGLDVPEVLNELSKCGRFMLADIDVADDKTKVFIEIL